MRRATWTIDQVALHAAWLYLRRKGAWREFREFAPDTMNWMDDEFTAEEAANKGTSSNRGTILNNRVDTILA
jgi:hypothetical protein